MTSETGASQELVLLAVRKSPHTRTVTRLQLPESVHLPRWFQAELTSTESACLTQSGPFTSFLWNPEWQLKHIGPPVQRSRSIGPNQLRFHLGAQMCVLQASGHCAGAWNSNRKGAQVLCESALVCSTFFVGPVFPVLPALIMPPQPAPTLFVISIAALITSSYNPEENSTKEPGAKPLKQDRDMASTNMTCHKLDAGRGSVMLDHEEEGAHKTKRREAASFQWFCKNRKSVGNSKRGGRSKESESITQEGNRTDQDLASRN